MHDRNGTQLQVGDVVTIECRIVHVYATPDFCNLDIETIHGRRPDGQQNRFSAINTAQVTLLERPEA